MSARIVHENILRLNGRSRNYRAILLKSLSILGYSMHKSSANRGGSGVENHGGCLNLYQRLRNLHIYIHIQTHAHDNDGVQYRGPSLVVCKKKYYFNINLFLGLLDCLLPCWVLFYFRERLSEQLSQ